MNRKVLKVLRLKAINTYNTKSINICIAGWEVVIMILIVGCSLTIMARKLKLLELIVRDAVRLKQK
jgi:hypothetical protein